MNISDFRYYNESTGDILSGYVEYDDNLFDYRKYISISYIKKILMDSTIYPRFRIFLLNQDETVKERICDSDILIGGSYNENYQTGVRRTLSFSLNNQNGKYTPNINGIWINTKLSFEIGLQIPGTENVVWFKKGTYIITQISTSRTPQEQTVSVECSDKFEIFNGRLGSLEDGLEIETGTDIYQIFQDIQTVSTGDGYYLDPKPLIYDRQFKGKKLPLRISLGSGSNYGQLITQLSEILSAEAFYNCEGVLTIVPITDVSVDYSKPVIYEYNEDSCNYQDQRFSINMSQFVNKIIVVGANINGHTCKAYAINDNPESPICTSRIGVRTGDVINDSNITNDIVAQERADYELRNNIIIKSSVNSSVFFNPIISVNNIVTYTDKFFNQKRERYIIQSLSFSLDNNGIMSLSMSNIKNLPFIV